MFLKTYIPSLLSVFICILVSGCEHEIKSPSHEEATLSYIQSTIFTLRCGISGCHVENGSAPMRLDTKSQSFSTLVDEPSVQKASLMRVQPGQPENSYIIHKIEGQPNISNRRMPPGGPFLSSEESNLISTWILEGAQNN